MHWPWRRCLSWLCRRCVVVYVDTRAGWGQPLSRWPGPSEGTLGSDWWSLGDRGPQGSAGCAGSETSFEPRSHWWYPLAATGRLLQLQLGMTFSLSLLTTMQLQILYNDGGRLCDSFQIYSYPINRWFPILYKSQNNRMGKFREQIQTFGRWNDNIILPEKNQPRSFALTPCHLR